MEEATRLGRAKAMQSQRAGKPLIWQQVLQGCVQG